MREKEVCMLGRLLDISDTKLKKKIERAPNKLIKFLCEYLLNIIKGNVPMRKNVVEGYEKSFRKLLSRQTSLKEKRQLFARETELVKIVGFACYRFLTKS